MSPTSYRTAPPRVKALDATFASAQTLECTTRTEQSKGESGLNTRNLRRGGLGAFDDEELFARLHEPELLAGDPFDRFRILAQQLDFRAEPRVVVLEPAERPLDGQELLTRFQILYEPFFADE